MEINLPNYYELPCFEFDINNRVPALKNDGSRCKLGTRTAIRFPELKDFGHWGAIYIITNDKFVYVGTTFNLRERIRSHIKNYGKIKVYFLRNEDSIYHSMVECIYKFKYLRKNKITGCDILKKPILDLSIDDMAVELNKISFN